MSTTAGVHCHYLILNDWCQCHKGRSDEKIIDLSDEAFSHFAGSRARMWQIGVLRVTVTW